MTEINYIEYQVPSDREILDAIEQDNMEILSDLCIPLAKEHENWRFVQDICVSLSNHKDKGVRASALMGLSMVTMKHLKIEKNIIKPALLNGLRDEDPHVRNAAKTATQDINSWMNWHIGDAQKNKRNEKRFYERKAKKANK